MGTTKNWAGQFASYFQAAKQGDQVLFGMISANANGAPSSDQHLFLAGSDGKTDEWMETY